MATTLKKILVVGEILAIGDKNPKSDRKELQRVSHVSNTTVVQNVDHSKVIEDCKLEMIPYFYEKWQILFSIDGHKRLLTVVTVKLHPHNIIQN